MSLEEKLTAIKTCIANIRQKIIDKGVYIAESTPLSQYPNYIQNINSTSIEVSDSVEEWQPDTLWWDIENIIKTDTNTGDYEYLNSYKKIIYLIDDKSEPDVCSKIGLSSNTVDVAWAAHAAKTSDGQIYTSISTSLEEFTHTWDKTQDKQSSDPNIKTRYVIFYYNPEKTAKVRLKYDLDPLFIVSGIDCFVDNSNYFNSGKFQALHLVNDAHFRRKSSSTTIPNNSTSTDNAGNDGFLKATNFKSFKFEANILNDNQDSNGKYYAEGFIACNTPSLHYFKIHANNYQIESDGLKRYRYPVKHGNYNIEVLDVSECDFENHYCDILDGHDNYGLRTIKGVIDLSNNKSESTTYYLFDDYIQFLRNFQLKLPARNNISFYIGLNGETHKICNNGCVNPLSLQYLVENAPVVEGSTIYFPFNWRNQLQQLESCPVTYNGQVYTNGEHVLEYKGWTVSTVTNNNPRLM